MCYCESAGANDEVQGSRNGAIASSEELSQNPTDNYLLISRIRLKGVTSFHLKIYVLFEYANCNLDQQDQHPPSSPTTKYTIALVTTIPPPAVSCV